MLYPSTASTRIAAIMSHANSLLYSITEMQVSHYHCHNYDIEYTIKHVYNYFSSIRSIMVADATTLVQKESVLRTILGLKQITIAGLKTNIAPA